ncbi:hypothetical protein ABNX05_18160 [Lysinibacillus sp. M3]|uniref:HK97 gp10 family phage protein n=1 Tax=Lysinibacillus zambalensis TaxID=3160866 RepID=A0ABV1MVM0_9BACI
MPTFSNIKDLEKYVQGKVKDTIKSPQVLNVFRHAMVDSVYTEVNDYYDPHAYERSYDVGGLSDARNMVFTKHKLNGNTFASDFENLTSDSMDGYFISELIENGSDIQHTSSNSENGWFNPDEKWAEPRPFAKATAEKLDKTTYNKHLKNVLEQGINN